MESDQSPASRLIDLIVFDCDGVLIDSETIAAEIGAGELNRLGFPIAPEELIRRFTGVPDCDMQEMIGREAGRPVPEDYGIRFKARIADAFRRDLKPIPGIRQVLSDLDWPVCVASSSDPQKLRLGLSTVGLYDTFAPNVFSASMVARGKPAPDLFLYAAERMRVVPERCLVVEDSVAGVDAAQAAGMRCLGFTGGSHCGAGQADLLAAAGALEVFDSMLALPVLIDRHAATIR